ncbi:YdcF family protein [Actinosynnema pretiosum subsp. pretiosum]|uniref:DUF218 domain-containing protein n=2 Tax=Actinosynnema TaxID=40566 RepID=C6WRH2_ACTMD|nr:YdcF family protein [Actinosynnema mirum]ACU35224.1 protein of unknown function DUF218 [Actinosynnema mirum DSM 43827]QUF07922.1 YdcF family protein [Actinosynnema pretiosum subsp. pretiosum]
MTLLARLRRYVQRTLLGGIAIVLIVTGGTTFRVWQVARDDDRTHADMAVVLGAAQYNGVPSDVLAARLEHARRLYEQDVVDYIVTTGGRQPGDNFTEGEAGRIWLEERGVPADRVIEIGEGTDTLGSIKAVAVRAHERSLRTAVIVSDPWHSLRARTMAEDQGLDAWTSPTRSGPNVQTREMQLYYIRRETMALMYYHLLKAPVDAVDDIPI